MCDAPENVRLKLLRGLVGEGAAGEFHGYLNTLDLPSLEDILNNPKRCHIPDEPSSKYALATMLGQDANRDNFSKLLEYTGRSEFGRDFEVCTVMDATKREPTLCDHKAYTQWALRNKDFHL